MAKKENFTFIDLFAGIGGLRQAFESSGGKCLFSSEWNKFSQQTYEANFGEVPYGDITEIDEKEIPDHDILVGGFPCQPFSIAGVSAKNHLGREHGFKDETQGTLFFDVCRIIKEKQPSAFLLENVKNLKSHDKGNTFKVIVNALEKELNYDIHYKVVDAGKVVPQHRERIFIVGFKEPLDFQVSRTSRQETCTWVTFLRTTWMKNTLSRTGHGMRYSDTGQSTRQRETGLDTAKMT